MTDPTSSLDLCVAIIVCDAQRTIEQTIRSVSGLASKVIVVDSGSTDRTLTICAELGAEVVHHEWDGYGRQKQFALELCDSELLLAAVFITSVFLGTCTTSAHARLTC